MTATAIDQRALFDQLCTALGVQPGRDGEAHVACPSCGKPAMRGQVHFSFSERGGKCFVCSFKASLVHLARLWGQRPMPAPAYVQPATLQRKAVPTKALVDLAKMYARSPELVANWSIYKPVPEAQIREYRLGFGHFPQGLSRCQHYRLMVPICEDGHVVGIRGRQIDCDCGKWLSPQGSKCALFNAHKLEKARGRVLWIVENPVDAILLDLRMGDRGTAVATLGVSIWNDDYTARVQAAEPLLVRVCYDNDRPGNGGGEAARREWLKTHPKDIEPNGVRLVNRLLAAGLNARLFEWPAGTPLHADIGDLLRNGGGQ